jgi:hypothetical protein
MDPIDVRADTTFTQALRCVQYRLPGFDGYKAPGYALALGARYGMVGIAASHHLLVTAEDHEEARVLATIESWPSLVEDHVRWDIAHRLSFGALWDASHLVAGISSLPLQAYLPLYKRMCPLANALDHIERRLVVENRAMIFEGWPWLRRKSALRRFQTGLRESNQFAMHFFERRQADLDELPEIALIGE